MIRKIHSAVAVAMVGLGAAVSASGQSLDSLGTRAPALAAFVAVADDASAVAWNPAGLVAGPIFNVQMGLGHADGKPGDPRTPGSSAGTHTGILIAIGTTPVGLTYYRLADTSFAVVDPAALGSPDRQHRRVSARTLVTSHLGATVQQSIGNFVTLGATIKLVRGSVGTDAFEAASWDDAFDRARRLARESSTRGDVDLGAMFAAGQVKVGVVLRNTTAPSFGEEGTPRRATLERHARVGVAWGDRWPGVSQTIVAMDADVTRVPHWTGDRRDVAVGLERWVRGRQVGVRGGVRASTVGDARVVWSAGGSYALRAGTYADVFVAGGSADHHAWGLAARLTY
jgi:hypothetical protein